MDSLEVEKKYFVVCMMGDGKPMQLLENRCDVTG